MSVGCEDEDNYFSFEDFIHKPMFLGDSSAPHSSSTSFKLLGMSGTFSRMIN